MSSATPPPAAEGDFRVVVFAAPDDPEVLGDLLAEQLRLHPTEARIHAHAVPGLLPDFLPEEKARELAAAIRELGVNVDVARQAEVLDLDDAPMLHHVRCAQDGLEIENLHGQPKEVVSWSDIALISVGHVPLDRRRRYQVDRTLLHSAPQPPDGSTDVPAFHGPEMWLIFAGPERGCRIEHNEMNYEYLGERKTTSATHNFRLFVDDLIARAPHAYLTPAARAYSGHGLLRHYQFDSLEEHRRYVTFHLLLAHQFRQ